MLNLIAELVFVFSVTDWGNARDVIEHYYWRIFK